MRVAARAGMRKAKVRAPASSPSFCTACWPTARASSPIKLPSLQPANRRRLQVRAVRETGPPKTRSRRRDDGSGQADVISAGLRYCATLDWPTCSSSDPIRWRPSADPG